MLLRIILWSLIAFFLIRFLWRIASTFFGKGPERTSDESVRGPQNTSQPPVPYEDIEEAKFKDLPKDGNESHG